MNEWVYMPRIYCPSCGGFSLWGSTRMDEQRVIYCVRCETRIVIQVTGKVAMSDLELGELASIRYLAGVSSNSAVGAFG